MSKKTKNGESKEEQAKWICENLGGNFLNEVAKTIEDYFEAFYKKYPAKKIIKPIEYKDKEKQRELNFDRYGC